MTARTKPTPCGACGEGMLRPTDIQGRMLAHRDEPRVPVREAVVVPVCDHCGDIRLDDEQTAALEAALERSYDQTRIEQQVVLIEHLTNELNLSQTVLEHILGVSPGYVSKLRRGEKPASAPTYRLMYVLHAAPREALRALARVDPAIEQIAEAAPRALRCKTAGAC